MEANVALVENNAKVGALIACAYAPLARQHKQEVARTRDNSQSLSPTTTSEDNKENSLSPVAPFEHKDNHKALLQHLKEKAASTKQRGGQGSGSPSEAVAAVAASSDQLESLWDSLHSASTQAEEQEQEQGARLGKHYSLTELDDDSDFILPSRSSPLPHLSSEESCATRGIPRSDIELESEEDQEEGRGVAFHPAEVVVFGGAVVDQIMTPLDTTQVSRSDRDRNRNRNRNRDRQRKIHFAYTLV